MGNELLTREGWSVTIWEDKNADLYQLADSFAHIEEVTGAEPVVGTKIKYCHISIWLENFADTEVIQVQILLAIQKWFHRSTD